MPRDRSAPLPLVGRSWGWGPLLWREARASQRPPTRLASLATLPTRGRVKTEFAARLSPSDRVDHIETRRLQHLARVEDALRIERAFERAHEIVGDRVLHLGQEIALHHADAVLGRDRA